MRRWKDCRGTPERVAALKAAFAGHNNARKAAALLGIDRSYLYDVLRTHGDPRQVGAAVTAFSAGAADAVASASTPNGVASTNTPDTTTGGAGVGRSPEKSLTYRHAAPTFRGVTSAIADTAAERTELLTVEIPKRCKDWLEIEAVRRKQRGEIPRSAMKAVITELIERAMADDEGADE